MLVLSRKVGEEIIITVRDTTIRLMVVDMRAGKVRIGIEAPRHVPIVREELANRQPGREIEA